MDTFRERQDKAQAIQWDGTVEGAQRIIKEFDLLGECSCAVSINFRNASDVDMTIRPRGTVYSLPLLGVDVQKGDYIMQGVRGPVHVRKDDFERRYVKN